MTTVQDVKAWLGDGRWSNLFAILDDAAIAAVLGAGVSHKEHPLLHILRSADPAGNRSHGHADLVLMNTEWAIAAITHRGGNKLRDWLAKRVQFVCHKKDFAIVAAALGEIRAGGFLTDARFDVEPVREGKAKTPEFKVTLSSGPLFVEVHTRNMHEKEAAALREFHDAPFPQHRDVGGVKEHVVHPMGKPKPGETNAENVAQKFAGIKPRGEQVPKEYPAILWLDLQDEDAWTFGPCAAEPVWVDGRDGDFFTSGLWHAFYGVKGTPLFEAHAVARRPVDRPAFLPFHGTFAQHDAWSAVVLGMASATVVFENPTARHRLPPDFFGPATRLFRFDYGLSWLDWPPGTRPLADRVQDTRAMLGALAQVVRYRW
jgi:hypothetical protein